MKVKFFYLPLNFLFDIILYRTGLSRLMIWLGWFNKFSYFSDDVFSFLNMDVKCMNCYWVVINRSI